MTPRGYVKPLKRKHRRQPGLYESCRMFNKAFDKVFCANRPWLRWNAEPSFTRTFGGRRPQPGKELLRQVASHIAAMDLPPKGTIKRMAEANGLKLASLYAAVHAERKRRQIRRVAA